MGSVKVVRVPILLILFIRVWAFTALCFTVCAGELCEVPSSYCQSPDLSGGRISTDGVVVCADDFRLERAGCCGGDVNGDGAVNMFDIDPFVDAITSQVYVCEADTDCDGRMNNFDITGFIEAVHNGTCSPCSISQPEFSLSQLCWWGAHLGEDTTSDDFRVVYYRDNNGFPGAAVCGPFVQSAGTLIVQTEHTGARIDETYPERAYHAVHPDCGVRGDACYWVEISNQANGVLWLWEFSSEGNQRSVRNGIPTIGDHAFCVDAALATGGACGL